ncbi:MAG: outer membrane protein assembly factor BamD [Candidatus Aminicenantia bacterium]
MFRNNRILFLLISFILIFSYCGKKEIEVTPEIASSDEALFKLGEKYIKKDPEKARLYFRQVIDSFPKSHYAQRAKLAIGDAYFKQGDEGSMILAASEYREFISLYPFSPLAARAQYQIGMTYYKKMLKPGRDQTKTKQALEEFKKVVANYPYSEEAKLTEEKIKECEDRLAEHIFEIAYFYYKTKAFKAAVERFKQIIGEYPNYSKIEKVYFYLAKSLYKWNKTEESIPFFTKLITDFPKSKYALQAKEIMDEISKGNK